MLYSLTVFLKIYFLKVSLEKRCRRQISIHNYPTYKALAFFAGEYSGNSDKMGGSWKPGSACVDEKGNIFVTDSSRNRVILLSPTGEFLKEWITLIENANSIACNGAGIILVAGSNKDINVYHYEYYY